MSVSAPRKSPKRKRARLTHADRADRRRKMAERVRLDGEVGALGRVARAFRVTTRTVSDACKEHDVEVPAPDVSNTTLLVIKDLQADVDAGLTPNLSDVARTYHVSRQRVHQIKDRAVELGLLPTGV